MNLILPALLTAISGSGATGTVDPGLTALVTAVITSVIGVQRAWVLYRAKKARG